MAPFARRPPTGVAGWLLAKQALFYRALSGLIRAAKTDGSAYWGLMGISFVYGIFHAAGPGHGKAVISSYLLANEETWRRGIALSFASALLQALTAVLIVAVAAVLIGATAKMMGDTVRVIETGQLRADRAAGRAAPLGEGPRLSSYSAPRSGRDPKRQRRLRRQRRTMRTMCTPPNPIAIAMIMRTTTMPITPTAISTTPTKRKTYCPGGMRMGPSRRNWPGRAAGAAVCRRSLRSGYGPVRARSSCSSSRWRRACSWAGVASTFVMGLGTAITVATIATLAVAAKAAAKRFAAGRNGYGALILRGVEVGAALAVMLFGVLMLTGTMASERMGMF